MERGNVRSRIYGIFEIFRMTLEVANDRHCAVRPLLLLTSTYSFSTDIRAIIRPICVILKILLLMIPHRPGMP